MNIVSRLSARHRWLPFVAPLLVFLLLGELEPRRDGDRAVEAAGTPAESDRSSQPAMPSYPLAYSIRLAVTTAVAACFLPAYLGLGRKVHAGSVLVGVTGFLAWILLCGLHWEALVLQKLGIPSLGTRAAFDPFGELGSATLTLYGFLGVRFLGLVVVVPLIEELFLRGFLLRVVASHEWWSTPIGGISSSIVGAAVVYGVATHPAEALAAGCFFSLVTWWTALRKNIWDAVVAHAVTNLCLGIYVLWFGVWELW